LQQGDAASMRRRPVQPRIQPAHGIHRATIHGAADATCRLIGYTPSEKSSDFRVTDGSFLCDHGTADDSLALSATISYELAVAPPLQYADPILCNPMADTRCASFNRAS
jgi:hypothetical protein